MTRYIYYLTQIFRTFYLFPDCTYPTHTMINELSCMIFIFFSVKFINFTEQILKFTSCKFYARNLHHLNSYTN